MIQPDPNRKTSLERLLKPKTLAVFGGDRAIEVIRQCRKIGFPGEIWAVNPKRRDIEGVKCFADVAELPSAPDASFIAVPAAASVSIIRDLAERDSGGAVCFAAGFAEEGAAGARLQEQLQSAAGAMAVVGPNCHGFLNYLDGVALWPDQHGGRRVEKGVALILQSGNIGINLTMQQRGLSLSHMITVGNKAVLDFHDYVDFLLDDPRVTAIGLHIEGLQQIHEFSLVALKALEKRVPIVAIKTGRSRLGALLTMSHTSSLAGPDKLYSALFDRLGIARCDTLSQFVETLKFLSTVGTLPGKRVGSMSCSGGEASLVADCADGLGIDMPPLTQASKEALSDALGANVHLANPLDYHTYAWGHYDTLNACFSAMLRNPFDCTMLVLDYPLNDSTAAASWEITERALTSAVASTGQRAVVVSSLPETLPPAARERLLESGITPMQGLEECLFAIRAASHLWNAQQNVHNILPVRRPEIADGTIRSLDEWRSKAELSAHGLDIPAGLTCIASATAETAEVLGYPVVVKALSSSIAHKTELGAVSLNLHDGESVRDATQRMAGNFEQFLVEKMVGPSVAEMIIGVSRDPTFGLTMLLGAGGTLVELLDDTALLLLPVRRAEILAALKSLKICRILESYRGQACADIEAIVDAVECVAAYALANNATLIELDINPLIITPTGVSAADAFIRRFSAETDFSFNRRSA